MSQRTLTLPIRTLASQSSASQWICRRCLATQTLIQPIPSKVSLTTNYKEAKPKQFLSTHLPQGRLPDQYLQHIDPEVLPIPEQEQWEKVQPHKKIVGVVVSHGKMDKTVRMRVAGQRWNNRIKKYYRHDTNFLVHDPNNSLVTGDVIEAHRLKTSAQVEHVVASIVSPFGRPVEARPPIPTPEERLAEYKQKRFIKLQRRELRRLAADGDADASAQLTKLGFDPGAGAEPGVGREENTKRGVGKDRSPSSGAILGNKGQKLPEGVLPGGKHAVGKINDRSQHNKGKAMDMDEKAEERLLEAKEKGEELEREGLGSDSALR